MGIHLDCMRKLEEHANPWWTTLKKHPYPSLCAIHLPFTNSSRHFIIDGGLPIRDSHSINSHPSRAYTYNRVR